MSDEQKTWRVVLASGEVLSVDVCEVSAGRWVARLGHRETFSYRAPEYALDAFLSAYRHSAVREVLAPGEPTRAEAVAAERERCARLCDEVVRAWDTEMSTAQARGHAEYAEACSNQATGANECAKSIRAGGV